MTVLSGSSATSRLIEGDVAGDAVPRFALLGTGQIEIGSGSAARDVTLYRSAANTLATNGSLALGGSLTVSPGGTAINAVDRAATTNFAAYVLRTTAVDRWSLQMVNDETNDIQLTDSANGTVALLAESRATAANLSLLTGTKSYGGGAGVVFIPNASTAPTTNPTGGAVVYVEGGVLKCRESSGTVSIPGRTGNPTPAGQGLAAWAFDPAHIQGGTAMSASGTAQVIRVQATGAVATNIEIEVTTGGSGLSTCYGLITNDAGVQIGTGAITTDQAVPWATTGLKQMALTAPQAITPGAFYKIVLWAVGTPPQLARGAAGRPATVINSGAAQPRFATANTGLSTAPDPAGSFVLDTQTAIGTAFWAAIS